MVQLDLKSSPENVALVRAALAGFAEALQFTPELAIDLQTAVSEACNNTVVHAYLGQTGPLCVKIEALGDGGVMVTVLDRGQGLTHVSTGGDRMGLGLAIISALADRAEFLTPSGGGTEVRMRFRRHAPVESSGEPSFEAPAGKLPMREAPVSDAITGDVIAWISPIELTRSVLGRILRAVAADAYFSVNRLVDLHAVNDAIAGYAELAAQGCVGVAISSSRRQLSVIGGPFTAASAADTEGTVAIERARQIRDRKRALDAVLDSIRSEQRDGAELLHMVVADGACA